MNFKTTLKTSVAAAALMAVAAPAFAQDTFMSMDRMRTGSKLVIYGQVNKAVLWGDDGNNSRTFIVDNSVSSTRLGFIATAPVNADFKFEAQIELEANSNQSGAGAAPQGTVVAGVTINSAAQASASTDTNAGTTGFNERIADVRMDHKRFGVVTLGNGSTSTDGITENYLGGAVNVIGPLSTGTLNSTVLFDGTNQRYARNITVGSATAAAVTQGSGISYSDGARDDRVRYDTPRFLGFGANASFASGGEGAGDINYRGKLGQFQIAADAGYSNYAGRSANQTEAWLGSVAVLHDSGLNASIHAAHRRYKENWMAVGSTNFQGFKHRDTGKGNAIGGTVGYIAKIFGVGPTALGVDYHSFNGFRIQGSDTTTWGLGVEQTFANTGTSVYLGYRNFDHDVGDREKRAAAGAAGNVLAAGGDYDDVNLVIAGVRVLF